MDLHCSKHSQMEIYTCTPNARPFGIQAQMFSFHTIPHVHIGSTCYKLYAVNSTVSYVYPWEFMSNCMLSKVKCSSGGLEPPPWEGQQGHAFTPLLAVFSVKCISNLAVFLD